MKTKKNSKKLRLNKTTIATLYNVELNDIRGGTAITCAGSFHSDCPCRSCQDKCYTPPPDPKTV